jgi:hypothetical protein
MFPGVVSLDEGRIIAEIQSLLGEIKGDSR